MVPCRRMKEHSILAGDRPFRARLLPNETTYYLIDSPSDRVLDRLFHRGHAHGLTNLKASTAEAASGLPRRCSSSASSL